MKDTISCIYGIKNLINGKYYIGQTYDKNYRWAHHKSDLRHNHHHSKHLQYAWNKYGENNFLFFIIEKCTCEKLDERESYWIRKLNTYNDGYNQDYGGLGIRGYKHTEEQLNKMRRIQNPKIVLQFDLSFRLVNEWIGGVSQINKTLKYTKDCILIRCEHSILNKMTPYKNYYWMFKSEYESPDFSWWDYFQNVQYIKCKVICQYDLNFNLIKKWDSYYSLKMAGYNTHVVVEICKKTCTQKVYKNSVWAYEGYDFSDGYFGSSERYIPKNDKAKRRVSMHKTKNGNAINEFESMTKACEYLGLPKEKRSQMCASVIKGQRFYGFYWKYA